MSEQANKGEGSICTHCGAECGLDGDWTEEAAEAEAAQNFPGIDAAPSEEKGVLCDDCYGPFMEWMESTYGPGPWPHLAELPERTR